MSKQLENKLRIFSDEDDLFDNADSKTILGWVNKWAEKEEDRKAYQQKYQAKKRVLARYAKQFLDRDELAAIERQVEANLAGEGEGND